MCVCVCACVDILKGSSNEHCGRAGAGNLQTEDLHRNSCSAPSGLRPQVREIWQQIMFRRQPLGKWINTKQGCDDKVVTAKQVRVSEDRYCKEYSLLGCDDMFFRNVGQFHTDYTASHVQQSRFCINSFSKMKLTKVTNPSAIEGLIGHFISLILVWPNRLKHTPYYELVQNKSQIWNR
jgi:hypothetical protein